VSLAPRRSPSEDLREELLTRGLQKGSSALKRAPVKQEEQGTRHRRGEACEGLLVEGMEGMGARAPQGTSPNLVPAAKKVGGA
jgi:hypothetical protein